MFEKVFQSKFDKSMVKFEEKQKKTSIDVTVFEDFVAGRVTNE